MAKNRESEKPVTESDDEATSEEAGSDESEQMQVNNKPSSSTPQQQPQPTSSSDEEDSGSESDPKKSHNGARNPRPKPVTPAKSTAAKRPEEEKETEAKDTKKSKKKPEPENSDKKSNDDSKKLLFQRIWSEDDEIVILKGMIDYATKKKSDPVADLNAFHDFIKKNLHVDVTRTQLQDKIRRLKRKYENNKSKEKEGKARTFSKPHEQKAYELSKKIWGNENGKENGGEKVVGSPKGTGNLVRKTPSKRAGIEEAKDVKRGNGGERLLPAKRLNFNGVSVEKRILSIGTELFEGEMVWKKLRREEMEFHLRQLEVKSAQLKLVIDALKSTDH